LNQALVQHLVLQFFFIKAETSEEGKHGHSKLSDGLSLETFVSGARTKPAEFLRAKGGLVCSSAKEMRKITGK